VRGTIPDLESPQPLGAMVPGIYQADSFAQRFTSGLDAVLAPVLCTLDNLSAYFDPRTAPEDFLQYLSGWVGIHLQESWSIDRRRDVVRRAVEIHRWRGTAGGIRDTVAMVLDVPVEVIENGGATWSQRPGGELPGRPEPELVIRVDLPEISDLERRRLDALVSLVKPAHMPHRIVVGRVSAAQVEAEPDRNGSQPPGGDPDPGSSVE
jgi:phage tail-like protein